MSEATLDDLNPTPDEQEYYEGKITHVELMRRKWTRAIAAMTPEKAAKVLREISTIPEMNEYLTACQQLEVIARWIEQQGNLKQLIHDMAATLGACQDVIQYGGDAPRSVSGGEIDALLKRAQEAQ